MNRRLFLTAISAALATAAPPHAQATDRHATLYKNPQCGCCEEYAKYLRTHGFEVDVVPTHDLDHIKTDNGVPERLGGCHTTLIAGYVVEGHVPVNAMERLLRERPARLRGISLPGMPAGSPGMSGRKLGPFQIYEIPKVAGEGEPRVYARE